MDAFALRCDSKERSGALVKLTRRGYAEQRKVLTGNEYRITPAGRDYVHGSAGVRALAAARRDRNKALTKSQQRALMMLAPDGAWSLPESIVHNGTLAALIRRGYVEWSDGEFTSVWQLARGKFALTRHGIAARERIQNESPLHAKDRDE